MPAPKFIDRGWELNLGEHVRTAAWSPDGRRLLAGLGDGRLALMDAAKGAVLKEWSGHLHGTMGASWSADGTVFASGGEDGLVKWWRASTGELIREREGGASWVEHLAWAPTGAMLAAGCGKFLKIWDEEGTEVFSYSGHGSSITGLQWRGDGRGVGTASYGAVQLFRLGETLPYDPLLWKAAFLGLAWSPDGRRVAAGTMENTVVYWKLPFQDEEPLHMSGYPAKVRQLAWDSSSRWLATGGGEIITVWDVSGRGPAGRKPVQLKGHSEKITALSYQRKGGVLASGCQGGEVRLWSPARSDTGVRGAALGAEVTALVFSPDDTAILAGTAEGRIKTIQWAEMGREDEK